MNKILLTADLHIHNYRNDQRRVEDGLECLEWIYKTAKCSKCDNVVIAGDLLHNRFLLPVYAYSKVCNEIQKAKDNGVNTILLLGNHDMLYEDDWSVHSLMGLHGICQVVEQPCTLDIAGCPVDFLPYTAYPSKYLDGFKNPSPMLISHLPVAEAILNALFDIRSVEDDSKDKEVLPLSAFNRWKKVKLGHYHYGQKLNNIVEYIGSPMSLSYGEANQIKHVAIIDLETLESEYVVNKISPQFYVVDDERQIPLLDLKNSYVQMRTRHEITAKFDMRGQIEAAGAREVDFIPPKVDVVAQTSKALSNIASVINNKDQVIEEFVNNCKIPSGLDKVLLKQIGKSIVNGD